MRLLRFLGSGRGTSFEPRDVDDRFRPGQHGGWGDPVLAYLPAREHVVDLLGANLPSRTICSSRSACSYWVYWVTSGVRIGGGRGVDRHPLVGRVEPVLIAPARRETFDLLALGVEPVPGLEQVLGPAFEVIGWLSMIPPSVVLMLTSAHARCSLGFSGRPPCRPGCELSW